MSFSDHIAAQSSALLHMVFIFVWLHASWRFRSFGVVTTPLLEPRKAKSMRISLQVRLAIAGAVIGSGSFLFAISAWASTSAVACPATEGTRHVRAPAVRRSQLEQAINYGWLCLPRSSSQLNPAAYGSPLIPGARQRRRTGSI